MFVDFKQDSYELSRTPNVPLSPYTPLTFIIDSFAFHLFYYIRFICLSSSITAFSIDISSMFYSILNCLLFGCATQCVVGLCLSSENFSIFVMNSGT